MKSLGTLVFAVICATVMSISGCGGGGGGGGDSATVGSLSVSATVSGTQIVATAKYSNPLYSDLQGVKIDFASSQSSLVVGTTVSCDSTGTAVAVLNIVGVPSVETINIVARTGNLIASAPVSLTLPSLSLSLNTTDLTLGIPLVATAKYSNPHAASLKGVDIVFSSNNASLFDAVTVKTDDTGTAVAYMVPKNTISSTTNALISAKRDTQVQTASVTVKPASLTISAPADATKEISSTTGGYVRFIPSGVESFTVVKTGDGLPVANAEVTLSIQTILNGTGVDVIFWEDYPVDPYIDPTTITITTDSAGQFPIQATVDVPVGAADPGTETTNIVTVVWKVTYNSPSGLVTGYASTMYTVVNSVPE